MRVLITHDFYEAFGGAERVTAEIARTFPDAEVHAILGRRGVADRMGIAGRTTTLLPDRPGLLRGYRRLAPLYPSLVRAARLPAADVVIASSYAYAHGFRTVNRAPVICYSHGPLRHLWSQKSTYAASLPGGPAVRLAFDAYALAARRADRTAADGVRAFLTQSPFTVELIERAYGRAAALLPPSVDCDRFVPSGRSPGNYFLFAGRLVEPYKRPGLVVDAFREMPDLQLRIAGDGPVMEDLRARATPNVEFLGVLGDADLTRAMAGCRAAIFPSVDDFGLVPLEVNACGRPVIAARGGGALYTVREGVSGEFLRAQTSDAIVRAVRGFRTDRYDAEAIREHALRRDGQHFRTGLMNAVHAVVDGVTPIVEPVDGVAA